MVAGLIVAGPLALLLAAWRVDAPWGVWVLFAPVAGLLLHQAVRWRFEAAGNGFRNPKRGSLAAIIESGHLAGRYDAGDLAYQAYEIVFYVQTEWREVRDHLHRCWFYVLWFRTIALACWLGSGIGAMALLSGGRAVPALLYLVVLPLFAVVLFRKGEQTLAALHLFDRALVLTHWPLYEKALSDLVPPAP
jgi:hypothetical protein